MIQIFMAHVSDAQAQSGGPQVGLNIQSVGGAIAELLRRIHKLSLDAQPAGTYGFSAEGAILYNYEMKIGSGRNNDIKPQYQINGIESMDDSGRDAGGQLFPFKYSMLFTPDGEKRVSLSAFAFRNMNTYHEHFGKMGGYHNGPEETGFFSMVNNLDFLTLAYDENYTYDNLKTLDFKIVTIEPRIGISQSKERKSYLTIRTSADVGFGRGKFTQPDGSTEIMSAKAPHDGKVVYQARNRPSFRFNYSAGLEYNKITKQDGALNIQANWKGGYHQVRFSDSDRVMQNVNKEKAYYSAVDQYDQDQAKYDGDYSKYRTDVNTYVAEKRAYYESLNPPKNPNAYSDHDYFLASGNPHPTKPTEPTKVESVGGYPSNLVKAPRTYGIFSTSLAFSQLVNRKKVNSKNIGPDVQSQRPYRVGFEIEWNVLVHDKFKNPPDGTKYDFDFKSNFRREVVGRIVFKF